MVLIGEISMSNLWTYVIIVLIAIPFIIGIKKIYTMISKKGSSCGCGSSNCSCQKGDKH